MKMQLAAIFLNHYLQERERETWESIPLSAIESKEFPHTERERERERERESILPGRDRR